MWLQKKSIPPPKEGLNPPSPLEFPVKLNILSFIKVCLSRPLLLSPYKFPMTFIGVYGYLYICKLTPRRQAQSHRPTSVEGLPKTVSCALFSVLYFKKEIICLKNTNKCLKHSLLYFTTLSCSFQHSAVNDQ